DRLWPRLARVLGFSRFSVMEPLKGRSPGWLSRAIRLVLALLALLLVLDFNYPVGMPAGGEFDKSANATWLEARWSDTLVPPEQRMEMAGVLARHGIKWLYADEGTLEPDGNLPRTNFMFAGG